MRTWVPLLMCLAAPSIAHDRIEIIRAGVPATLEPRGQLERDLVRLLASCSVDSTGWAVKPATWAELRRSPWRVHLNLVTPLKVQTQAGVAWATDILVLLRPDSYPGHVYVKLGQDVRAFTKYHPGMLLAVSRDPALGLIGARPYAQLERADDAVSRR